MKPMSVSASALPTPDETELLESYLHYRCWEHACRFLMEHVRGQRDAA